LKFLLDHDVPDALSYLLEQLGHDVTLLRNALPGDSSDEVVLQFAHDRGLPAINLQQGRLSPSRDHQATSWHVIVIRRRTRADERAALFRLLELASQHGLRNNVDFA
jgi:hypothetical protein